MSAQRGSGFPFDGAQADLAEKYRTWTIPPAPPRRRSFVRSIYKCMDQNNCLDKDELVELDRQIDLLVPSLELLSTNRRLALCSVLTEFDALVQSDGTEPNLAQRSLSYRGAYNALNHAVRWIFTHCSQTSSFVPTRPALAALSLLEHARRYEAICTLMSLSFRGRYRMTKVDPNRVLVECGSLENQEMETARSLMAMAALPQNPEETLDLPRSIADEIRGEISIRGVFARQLDYHIPFATYDKARSIMEERRLYGWAMGSDWDLGGYKFDDLRKVWDCLKTLQSLHQLALQKLLRQTDRRRLNIRIQDRADWVTEISSRSRLDAETVGSVFDDLIYNPDLHRTGQKRAHIMYQPFIEIAEGQIAQSNSLVLMSVVEKCSWILTEILRPSIHDQLKSRKEQFWIENGFKPFESSQIKVFPNLKFTLNNRSGDIDLLILDVVENFGLAAQLKWTTSMDNCAGVESDDKQYLIGVEQAIRSMEWIETNRTELAHRLRMPIKDLQSTIFRPIVIAKETLPSGAFPKTEVPVINEAIFRWIIREPHNATLRQLWQITAEFDYLPREGVHFHRIPPESIRWGDLEFVLKDVAYTPLERRWNPAVDIRLP